MTNGSGSVTGSVAYDAFGQQVASSGSSGSSYLFAATSGYRSDGDAGLSHVGARYFDAQVGRFITRDTYLDQHPYVYCDADPVNRLDPSGHNWGWGVVLVVVVLILVILLVRENGGVGEIVVPEPAPTPNTDNTWDPFEGTGHPKQYGTEMKPMSGTEGYDGVPYELLLLLVEDRRLQLFLDK